MWPSKEWFEEIKRTANASAELKELGKDWEGDFLCTIVLDEETVEDMKTEPFIRNYISMLTMLTKEDRLLFRGTPYGNFIERELRVPLDADLENLNVKEVFERVSGVNLDSLKGTSINFWVDFSRGMMKSYTLVAPGQHEDAPFKISGPYSAWKKVGVGEMSVPDLIVKGDLKFTGDITPIMSNLVGFGALFRVFSSVASRFRCQHCGYVGNKVEFKFIDTKLYGQLFQCPKCRARSK